MEKIALVNPAYGYPILKNVKFYYLNKIWPPLDLANCAALLEKECFDVKIFDANAERLTPNQVAKMVNGFNKIFITSSTLDRWQCPHPNIKPFLEFVKIIKEKNPNINIFVLGAHGTIRTKEILELTKATAIIRGEPELAVMEICKNKNLGRVKGITFKRGNRIISNPDRKPLDLNSLPLPSYHLLPLEKYFYEFLGDKFILFEGSRGCPFNCIYCLKKMHGTYRRKSPENLIKEVEYAIKKFGIKNGYFIDLEFTINKKLVEDLCNYLIKNNFDFKWCCQARFDTIDKNLLLKMKRAGCKLIHYGVETGSERILKLINKKITLEKIEKGMKLTKDVGIETACFFIFGLPTESLEDMKKTMDFAEKINPNYASFHIAIPYPETIFYDMIKKDLRDDLFPTSYTGIYSENQLKKIINYAYRRFYFRPSYIFSRLLNGNYELLLRQFKLFISHIR